jgi:hypothetical protein
MNKPPSALLRTGTMSVLFFLTLAPENIVDRDLPAYISCWTCCDSRLLHPSIRQLQRAWDMSQLKGCFFRRIGLLLFMFLNNTDQTSRCIGRHLNVSTPPDISSSVCTAPYRPLHYADHVDQTRIP